MGRGKHQNMIYEGYPVYIATKSWPKRKHRKKRINKGYVNFSVFTKFCKIILTDMKGVLEE